MPIIKRKKLTPEKRRLKKIKKIGEKPKILRSLRRGVVGGALIGALGASQGPAMKSNYKATQSSMREGAQITAQAQLSPSQKFKNMVTGKKPKTNIRVGERMFSGKDPQTGITHIGKTDVALQSVKTFKPRVEMTPSTAKNAGKGAAAGAGAGGILGIFSFFRKRRKYNKKVNDAAK
jgi:hypothetical protein